MPYCLPVIIEEAVIWDNHRLMAAVVDARLAVQERNRQVFEGSGRDVSISSIMRDAMTRG